MSDDEAIRASEELMRRYSQGGQAGRARHTADKRSPAPKVRAAQARSEAEADTEPLEPVPSRDFVHKDDVEQIVERKVREALARHETAQRSGAQSHAPNRAPVPVGSPASAPVNPPALNGAGQQRGPIVRLPVYSYPEFAPPDPEKLARDALIAGIVTLCLPCQVVTAPLCCVVGHRAIKTAVTGWQKGRAIFAMVVGYAFLSVMALWLLVFFIQIIHVAASSQT